MIGPLPIPLFVILLVVGILIVVFVPLIIVFTTIRRQYGPDARILAEAERAEATITRLWQTRLRVGNCFGIGLDFEVRRAGNPPYTATVRTLVGILDVPRFQVGQVVQVRVDPKAPERVYLDKTS